MRRILILSAAGLALAACEPPARGKAGEGERAAAPAGAFASRQQDDLSGYYIPADQEAAGGWTFHHLFIGQASDFQAWEAGRRSPTFAPIMIEFEGAETGEGRGGRARVLPSAYSVSDDRVRFEGRSQALGRVRFEGRLDPEALAQARRNLGDESPVLTGTLSVAGRSQAVRLRWWAGD